MRGCRAELYLQAELPEFEQGFRIAARVVHRIVSVPGDAIFFPFGRFGRVLHQARVKVADAPARKSEWITAEKAMEVVIDELPIEGERMLPSQFLAHRSSDDLSVKSR